jgi:hypothetical protein
LGAQISATLDDDKFENQVLLIILSSIHPESASAWHSVVGMIETEIHHFLSSPMQ